MKLDSTGPGTGDAELALRCARRDPLDEEAWRVLFTRLRPTVFYIVRNRLGGQPLEVAEELVQEAFLRLFTAIPQYNPELGSLSTFASGIAANLVRDFWRSPRSASAASIESGPEPAEEAWESRNLEALYNEVRADVIKAASPLQVEIFEALLDGESVAEIVSHAGLSPATVYRAREVCRQLVRDALDRRRNPI
jgi:RNA polymerase sigma factor (sigma-70 family)